MNDPKFNDYSLDLFEVFMLIIIQFGALIRGCSVVVKKEVNSS